MPVVCFEVIGDLGNAIDWPALHRTWPFNKSELVVQAVDICEVFPVDIDQREACGNPWKTEL